MQSEFGYFLIYQAAKNLFHSDLLFLAPAQSVPMDWAETTNNTESLIDTCGEDVIYLYISLLTW